MEVTCSTGFEHAGGINQSYSELFWEIWGHLGYSEPKDIHMYFAPSVSFLCPHTAISNKRSRRIASCYMFELVSERNRIITKVDRDRIGTEHPPLPKDDSR